MTDSMGQLEGRVRQLEDVQQIHDLFHRYGSYLDSGDFASYAKLFTEDGEVRLGPRMSAAGRGEIEAVMTKALGATVGRSFHVISSPIISLAGDRASAEVMYTVVVRGEGGQLSIAMVGWHKDQLVRQSDGWRFARRRGYLNVPPPDES